MCKVSFLCLSHPISDQLYDFHCRCRQQQILNCIAHSLTFEKVSQCYVLSSHTHYSYPLISAQLFIGLLSVMLLMNIADVLGFAYCSHLSCKCDRPNCNVMDALITSFVPSVVIRWKRQCNIMLTIWMCKRLVSYTVCWLKLC